jgi:hypothetical protein
MYGESGEGRHKGADLCGARRSGSTGCGRGGEGVRKEGVRWAHPADGIVVLLVAGLMEYVNVCAVKAMGVRVEERARGRLGTGLTLGRSAVNVGLKTCANKW